MKEILALVVGFIGIIFIMKPDGLKLELTDMLGLFSGIGAALAYTSVKELKRYYDTRVIVLSFMVVGLVGPMLFVMFRDLLDVEFLRVDFIVPDAKMWVYILGLGASATVAQIYMTKAYGASKAGIVGAVSYSGILFSLIIGVMLGDDMPDFWGGFGIALVILGGILVAKEKR